MDYKKTLNLPSTKFPMKANLPGREPEQLREWENSDLYNTIAEQCKHKKKFILHDGPPYANGHLHIGHAINKILKDIIIRSKRMQGFNAHYVPGWDCHGLPIEHAVDKKLGSKKKEMTKVQVRKECRQFAERFVDIQRDEFKRFGVTGEWENCYLTMNAEYEARISKECGYFALNGNMELGKKPIYWCCDCRTALAEAEIEYKDQLSPSIYVEFPVKDDISDLVELGSNDNASLVIWTTTPWTIPANLAVCLHPDFIYSAVRISQSKVVIIAKDLVERIMAEFGIEKYEVIAELDPGALENRKCGHPLYDRDSLVVLGEHVTLDAGTGCVHTAPGHGADDHIVGKRYGIDPYSPVEDDGKFSDDIEFFKGEFILKANGPIIEKLEANGYLMHQDKITHSYPHCWRCKKPVIFRATSQWFLLMDRHDLREKCLEEINNVEWIPAWGRERIYSMIENRPDWCLSRQRAWGVPIPLFHCKKCGEVYVTEESVEHIYTLFKEHSADIWYDSDADFLMPENSVCSKCKGTEFEKDGNILDVWFDSGVSHAAVLNERDDLERPADLYLEGSDQHRGWFHSSLITAVGSTGKAPYRSVLTHGFVVDEKGRKMSKSVGNVVAPDKVIKQYGADILRLWTASSDYRGDVSISDNILKQLSDAYRRIRNTCRFMIGNLYDFDPAAHLCDTSSMSQLDRFVLHRLHGFISRSLTAYDTYQFHKIYHSLYNFCVADLSSFYLDIIKDRLYTRSPGDTARRNAQTAMFRILDSLVRIMAPILSFTADEIWKHVPEYKDKETTVHMAKMAEPESAWKDEMIESRWLKVLEIRSEVTRALEAARTSKLIGHPLDASVKIKLPENGYAREFEEIDEDLRDIFIVSSAHVVQKVSENAYASDEIKGLFIQVDRADGVKCERCWKFDTQTGENPGYPAACPRCAKALEIIL
ncbi:MAG: isoleucine--tRNA ligase [Desulfobacteraceae bacterium]